MFQTTNQYNMLGSIMVHSYIYIPRKKSQEWAFIYKKDTWGYTWEFMRISKPSDSMRIDFRKILGDIIRFYGERSHGILMV